MKEIMIEDFLSDISMVLPLPGDAKLVSGDGLKQLDVTKAAKSIQLIIRRYKKLHSLPQEEVQLLKELAVKRFDLYNRSWNKIKNAPR